jgi:hypothetical protein
MFATIEQALRRYKKELRHYKAWMRNFELRYGALPTPGNPGYEYVTSLEHSLRTVEHVLGLTKREISAIRDEVGIGRKKTAA